MNKEEIQKTIENQTFIIGVCGNSGAGKTTLTKFKLKSFLMKNKKEVYMKIFHGDSCFQGKKAKFDPEIKLKNIEVPEACNYNRLLKKFQVHQKEEKEYLESKKSLIVFESFLLFCGPKELQDLFDLKIFLYTDKEISYSRRKQRRKRKNISQFNAYFEKYCWPCFQKNYEEYFKKLEKIKTLTKTENEPLHLVEDVYFINTTSISSDEVFNLFLKILQKKTNIVN